MTIDFTIAEAEEELGHACKAVSKKSTAKARQHVFLAHLVYMQHADTIQDHDTRRKILLRVADFLEQYDDILQDGSVRLFEVLEKATRILPDLDLARRLRDAYRKQKMYTEANIWNAEMIRLSGKRVNDYFLEAEGGKSQEGTIK